MRKPDEDRRFEPPLRATEHCRHYSYQIKDGAPIGPQCAAGMDMSQPGAALRCMPNPKTACPKREEYTADERAAWEEWCATRLARMRQIMPRIPGRSNDRKHQEHWGQAGSFDCPCCDGRIRWSRAPQNGHVRAACSTPHCFSVVE